MPPQFQSMMNAQRLLPGGLAFIKRAQAALSDLTGTTDHDRS